LRLPYTSNIVLLWVQVNENSRIFPKYFWRIKMPSETVSEGGTEDPCE
jgi:hypothetical protein